jgi:hypothetical protein
MFVTLEKTKGHCHFTLEVNTFFLILFCNLICSGSEGYAAFWPCRLDPSRSCTYRISLVLTFNPTAQNCSCLLNSLVLIRLGSRAVMDMKLTRWVTGWICKFEPVCRVVGSQSWWLYGRAHRAHILMNSIENFLYLLTWHLNLKTLFNACNQSWTSFCELACFVCPPVQNVIAQCLAVQRSSLNRQTLSHMRVTLILNSN